MKTTTVSEEEKICRELLKQCVYSYLGQYKVYFRASTLQEALDLDLKGWVRNLEDGRVECKAMGTESNLLTLLHWMGKGPIKAKVTRVDVEWLGSEDEIWKEATDGPLS